MSRATLVIALAAVSLPLAMGTAPAQDDVFPLVKTVETDEHGLYLVDAHGSPLYVFQGDTQGTTSTPAASACAGDCATAWPPLLAEEPAQNQTPAGEDQTGQRVAADMLGTVEREDGEMQVTYNGWPLYKYAEDEVPEPEVAGQPVVQEEPIMPSGHDVGDAGAKWSLIDADGMPIGLDG